jgi:hypothetical protein
MKGPNDQEVSLEYLEWQPLYAEEKPFEILIDIPKEFVGDKRTNLVFKKYPNERISDVRGKEDSFTLDVNGFAFRTHGTAMRKEEWADEHLVESKYFKEVEDLLRKELDGVDRVHIFDWRLRLSHGDEKILGRGLNLADPTDYLPPAMCPHVDQSSDGAINRVYFHLDDEADELLKGRVRIINVWRPLSQVEDWPLAICDGRTVQQCDLVASDVVRRRYIGETLFVLHSPEYQWYYLPEQRKEEVTLLKIYDNSKDIEAKSMVILPLSDLFEELFGTAADISFLNSMSTRVIQNARSARNLQAKREH